MDVVQHYIDRVAEFERQTPKPGGIVFLGSSHMEWFDTDRLLPDYRIINRAIAGDRIGIGDRGIYRRLDVSVFRCQPAQVVLQNGANDIGELYRTGAPSIEEIATCYQWVVSSIKSRLPDAALLLVCVLPMGRSRAEMSSLVPNLNTHIRAIADQYGCEVLDMWTDFADESGLLRPELTEDDLHLTEPGYRIYAERIQPHLLETP